MTLVLKRPWDMFDALKMRDEQRVVLGAGEHEVERIENPLGFKNAPWIVLKGTKIGRTEASLRDWRRLAKIECVNSRSKVESFRVIIRE